jgi:hypothetical protein
MSMSTDQFTPPVEPSSLEKLLPWLFASFRACSAEA